MKDLPRRLVVAAVGIPAVLWLGWSGGWVLAVPVAVLAALAAGETCRLAGARGVRPFPAAAAAAAAALVLLAAAAPTFGAFAPGALAVTLGVTGAVAVAAVVTRAPGDGPLGAITVTLFAILYSGGALAFVPLLSAAGRVAGAGANAPGLAALALPLACTWIGDSAAYFAGSAWGRAKLAPRVSPNKTWVGLWAGLAGAALAGAAWGVVAGLLDARMPGPLVSAAVGTGLGAAGQAGDLAESLLKREAGVKDSGTLFPGHGGVLDRIDSLVFAIPLAYLALTAFARWG